MSGPAPPCFLIGSTSLSSEPIRTHSFLAADWLRGEAGGANQSDAGDKAEDTESRSVLHTSAHHRPLSGPHPHAAVAALLGIQRPHQGADGGATNHVHRNTGLADGSHDPHLRAAPGGGRGNSTSQEDVWNSDGSNGRRHRPKIKASLGQRFTWPRLLPGSARWRSL